LPPPVPYVAFSAPPPAPRCLGPNLGRCPPPGCSTMTLPSPELPHPPLVLGALGPTATLAPAYVSCPCLRLAEWWRGESPGVAVGRGCCHPPAVATSRAVVSPLGVWASELQGEPGQGSSHRTLRGSWRWEAAQAVGGGDRSCAQASVGGWMQTAWPPQPKARQTPACYMPNYPYTFTRVGLWRSQPPPPAYTYDYTRSILPFHTRLI